MTKNLNILKVVDLFIIITFLWSNVAYTAQGGIHLAVDSKQELRNILPLASAISTPFMFHTGFQHAGVSELGPLRERAEDVREALITSGKLSRDEAEKYSFLIFTDAEGEKSFYYFNRDGYFFRVLEAEGINDSFYKAFLEKKGDKLEGPESINGYYVEKYKISEENALAIYTSLLGLYNTEPFDIEEILKVSKGIKPVANQIIDGQRKTVEFWREKQGIRGISVNHRGERGKGYLIGTPDSYFFRGANSAENNKPIANVVSKRLMRDEHLFRAWQDDVAYIMNHGFIEAPDFVKAMADSGLTDGRVHDTYFPQGDPCFTGTDQYQMNGGHYQGKSFDVKYVTEGTGVQIMVWKDKDGSLVTVAQRLEPGKYFYALPGTVDFIINFGGLRFNDISFNVDDDAFQGIRDILNIADDFDEKSAAGLPGNACTYVFERTPEGPRAVIDPDNRFQGIAIRPLVYLEKLTSFLSIPLVDIFRDKPQDLYKSDWVSVLSEEISYSKNPFEVLKDHLFALIVRCDVQHYAWGDPDYIPVLLQIDNRDGRPHAELWIGAHDSAPARADFGARGEYKLSDLIRYAGSEFLGIDTAREFNNQLPYLLKVLAAKEMLSIQAHPTKAQAEAGFARENAEGIPLNAYNRTYKDTNHKPELIVAIDDFYALNGFRSLEELNTDLPEELRPLIVAGGLQSSDDLRGLYEGIMTMPQEEINRILEPLIRRLEAQGFTKEQREYWVLKAHRQYTKDGNYDRGIISIYLLNLVHLNPGEGMFLPAGELHAYLEGVGMEDMANSDNVLRGGLTPKYVDVKGLLEILTFKTGKPAVLVPEQISPTEKIYRTPAREFQFSVVSVNKTTPHVSARFHSADMLIIKEGKVKITSYLGRTYELGQGQTIMIPSADGQYKIESLTDNAVLYKSTVGTKEADLSHAYALILAGGGGTRMWPWSTDSLPKQLLRLFGTEFSLIQESVRRALHRLPPERIYIQTIPQLRDKMIEAVRQFGVPAENVLCEPAMADTAAAIGYGTVSIYRKDKDATIITLTADHKISPPEKFWLALETTVKAAQNGPNVVCLGIVPTRPHTGFGYQEVGDGTNISGISVLNRFVEKPDLKTAEGYVASGRHLWNSGMFVFRADTMLSCFEELGREYYEGLRRMIDDPTTEGEVFSTFAEYKKGGSPSGVVKAGKTSIDYVVMEPLSQGETGRAQILTYFDRENTFFWEDVGDLGPGLRQANAELIDSNGNLIFNHAGAVLELTNVTDSNILIQEGSTVRKVVIENLDECVVAIGANSNSIVVMPVKESQRVKELQGQLDKLTGLTYSLASRKVKLTSDNGLVTALGMDFVEVEWKGDTIVIKGKPQMAFGTSGLRDLVVNMTDLECYINTKGFIKWMIDTRNIKPGDTISLAGDLRNSTPRITNAAVRAIVDSGCVVDYCGLIPTPAVAYYALYKGRACIMVTGSHIPDDRNGIKFYKREGEVLKEDEKGILNAVRVVRRQEYAKLWTSESLFDPETDIFKPDVEIELGKVNSEAERDYVKRYTDVFPSDSLNGLRILVYQHSAVGRDILVEILEALGAEVVPVLRSDKFIPVDTESIAQETLDLFKDFAGREKFFAIVSTDGDSDRPFVVDSEGTFYRGDVLGVVVARYLGANFSAVPVSASDAVEMQFQRDGRPMQLTRIGSPYVIRAMIDAMGRGVTNVGSWEVNGGFLTGSDFTINGKTFKALPTRDAAIAIISALLAAKEKGTVKQLFGELPQRSTAADRIKNFPTDTSKKMIKRFKPKDENIVQIDFDDTTPSDLLAIREQLAAYYPPEHGFGRIVRINYLDGIRIWFDNGDITHLRPSGNAPELRNYAVAGSQTRADAIVQDGLTRVLPKMMDDLMAPVPSPKPEAGPIARRVAEKEQESIWQAGLTAQGKIEDPAFIDSSHAKAGKVKQDMLEKVIARFIEKMGTGAFTVAKGIIAVDNLKEEVGDITPYAVVRDGKIYIDVDSFDNEGLLYLVLDHELKHALLMTVEPQNTALRELTANYLSLKEALESGVSIPEDVEKLGDEYLFLKQVKRLKELKERKILTEAKIISYAIDTMLQLPYYRPLFGQLGLDENLWRRAVQEAETRLEAAIDVYNSISEAVTGAELVRAVKVKEEEILEQRPVPRVENEVKAFAELLRMLVDLQDSNSFLMIDSAWDSVSTRRFNGERIEERELPKDANNERLLQILKKADIKSIGIDKGAVKRFAESKPVARLLEIIDKALGELEDLDFLGYAYLFGLTVKVTDDSGGKRITITDSMDTRIGEGILNYILTTSTVRAGIGIDVKQVETTKVIKIDVDSLTESMVGEIKALSVYTNTKGGQVFKFYYYSSKNQREAARKEIPKGLEQASLTGVEPSDMVTLLDPSYMKDIPGNRSAQAKYYLPVPYMSGSVYMAANIVLSEGKVSGMDNTTADWIKRYLAELLKGTDLEVTDLLIENLLAGNWSDILPKIEAVIKDLDTIRRSIAIIEVMA